MKHIKYINNFMNESFDSYDVTKEQLIEACKFFIEKCKTDNSIEIELSERFSNVYEEAYNMINDRLHNIIEDIDIIKLLLDFKESYPDTKSILSRYVNLPGK